MPKSLQQLGSHARVITRGALRDDATRQSRDEIGSTLFAQPIKYDLCAPVVDFLFF